MAAKPSPGTAGGLIRAAPRGILLFAARTLAWAVVFFAAWLLVAKPLSLATSWIAARIVETATPASAVAIAWHEGHVIFSLQPDPSTTFNHHLPPGMVVDVDVSPLKQIYGVPFLLALLAAGRVRRLAARAAIGAAILLLLAAIGIACEAAVGFGMARVGSAQPFAPAVVAGTLFALGFQLGTLIFPCVVPVALCVAFAMDDELTLRDADDSATARV